MSNDPSDIPPGWNNAKAKAHELGEELLYTPNVFIGDEFLLVQNRMSPPSVLTLSAAKSFRDQLDTLIKTLESHLRHAGKLESP